MMRYLLPLVMLAGCGPIPVQISKQSQEQTQRTSAVRQQQCCRSAVVPRQRVEAGNELHACYHHLQQQQLTESNVCHSAEGGALNDVVDSNLRSKTK